MKMEFHFLDVGPTKFGDCILCRRGDDLILIDGGHPGDQKARGDRRSLPDQIADIVGTQPPFQLKLLVITHAHLDHIGCLLKLVKSGIITAEWALVADEKLGWGRHQTHDGVLDSDTLSVEGRKLAAALREDEIPDLRNEEAVRAFLDAALGLEPTYKEILKTLADSGTTIVRHGRDSTTALSEAFSAWGLKILGPTKPHLTLCANAVAKSMSDAASLIRSVLDDGEDDAVALYRQLVSGPLSDSGGKNRPGQALNNQSIVLSFGKSGRRVLLAGDMQFIEPGIAGIETMMAALRKKAQAHGPYMLVKTCHHSSHNGIDATWIEEMGADALLVHSGGENDDYHPALTSLSLLRKRAKTMPGKWLRNDRNGLISCFIDDNAQMEVAYERGEFDDFSRNYDPDLVTQNVEKPPAQNAPEHQSTLVNNQPQQQAMSDESVEVSIRIPNRRTRVTVTIDVQPEAAAAGPPRPFEEPAQIPVPSGEWKLGGGRKFPKLLAVTDARRLALNVGEAAASQAIRALQKAGIDVLPEMPADTGGSKDARLVVREALRAAEYAGVLIIGGPDVVPPVIVDALPRELRAKLGHPAASLNDPDNFIVWSDHPYGDLDDQGINELPVSRVPDGRSAALLHAALTAPARPPDDAGGFGLRNLKRPFAENVYRKLAADGCRTTAPHGPSSHPPETLTAHRIYLMLHGIKNDGTVFAGEEEDESIVPALDLSNLPKVCAGSVIFTGCCWGALIEANIAAESPPGNKPSPRTSENSIALAFLRAGARAFIGCTGAHYSPDAEPYGFYGGPMHTAFWDALLQPEMTPALALHEARLAYLNDMPHGQTDVYDLAIEHKIFHQFTCLGLGW
jgi:beta-lactamase superfamily II metal-dependent hydrolase